ncbi:SMP-30/gluconolactonase/LRE family protein [Lentisphaerota bacterium WC36G]|nr:SMP-30/gluconolactonase/LRE family protein [Lentisphaerae bacterium WC36]
MGISKGLFASLALSALFVTTGCQCPFKSDNSEVTFKKEIIGVKPELFIDLGETFSVPDGLAVDANGNIVLAVPNYLEYEKLGAKIVTICPKSGKVISTFKELPKNPVTGVVHPMGIGFGPDGNLYIADNNHFTNPNHQSRVLRVNYKDGKAVDCDVVVEGLELANAIRWYDNQLYVSDTVVVLEGKKNQSGVYRFDLKDVATKTPLKITKENQSKYLLTTYTGYTPFGADGVTFDKEGNMYCGLFGDGQIFKTTFNKNRSVKDTKVVVDDPAFECSDGMMYNPADNSIYLTDSKMNSVWVYNLTDNTMQRLWNNNDDTGETGLLDQPCEPLVYKNKLYVVNFDMTFPNLMNRKNDKFNTISVFDLNKK